MLFYNIFIREGPLNILLSPKPVQEIPQDSIVSRNRFIYLSPSFSRRYNCNHSLAY